MFLREINSLINSNFKKNISCIFSVVLLLVSFDSFAKQKVDNSEDVVFPNVWAERQIFVFSALDGQTDYYKPFITVLLGQQLGIRLHNSGVINEELTAENIREKHPLWFGLQTNSGYFDNLPGKGQNCFDEFESNIITSSVINASVKKDDVHATVKIIFADMNTILGSVFIKNKSNENAEFIINNTSDSLGFIGGNKLILPQEGSSTILSVKEKADFENYKVKIAIKPGEQKTINFSYRIEYKGQPNKNAFGNFDSIYTKRLEPYKINSLKGTQNDDVKRTYLKAYSVMRANTESAVGNMKCTWTTPDRTPHRKMWLWDSGFHAMGIKYFDKVWAEDAIKAVLEYQREDGFIAHMMDPDKCSDITQPPVLAWAVWDVYQTAKDKSFLEYSFPKLKLFLEWIEKNRDANHNGLFEWVHGDESGMDNSPRFDSVKTFDAVDFSCFMVNDYYYMSEIAREIGKKNEAESFLKKKNSLIDNINKNLWDEDRRFYFDKYFTGKFSNVESISNFLSLFAKIADERKADLVIAQLTDSTKWWTNIPGPSVSLQDQTFGSNMWRGPVWVNYSYFNFIGLRNYGCNELAFRLLDRTINSMAEWYKKEGSIFEFYDPLNKTSPKLLPRKKKYGAILEYGWSCSLFLRMVNEQALK
jgi:hypothetical protein